MSQENVIYAYNQTLSRFFDELGSRNPLYSRRLEFGLTALSEGDAENAIATSKAAFRSMVVDHLRIWLVWSPDVYQAAMDVINFEVQ